MTRSPLPFLPAFLLGWPLLGCAPAAAAPSTIPAPSTTASAPPWLYVGSDVPVDKDWNFGVLPNGLRYAVRHNDVPSHQVSVRVVIDAGSLMETEKERGYAHFMEHLSFRGSKYDKDGDVIRVWQRLGTTFGSDTNAATTAVQTVYKLDLPDATRDGLTESLHLLAGMMSDPSLTPEGVESERRTVMAEARESAGADARVSDAATQLFYAGQLLETHSPIGTSTSLLAATPKKLRKFHDRWYRPDRSIIVIAGDADPSIFIKLISDQFGSWQGIGKPPPEPDFGRPAPNHDAIRIVTEPSEPVSLNIAYLRPWLPHNDTIAYNQGNMVRDTAIRILNRRLLTRARAGLSFLSASVDQSDVSRSVDETLVTMTPLNGDWQTGLHDLRGIIAQATTVPPTQAEIDREMNETVSDLDAAVEQTRAQTDVQLVDAIAAAVSIRETEASPIVARDIFGGMQGRITPAAVLEASRKLFSGVGPRVLLVTPNALPKGQQQLEAALSAPVTALASPTQSAISFDSLPKLGPPGTVVAQHKLAFDTMKIVQFSNGVRLILYPLTGMSGRVFVTARFGNGQMALPVDRSTPDWSGGSALISSGIGDLDENELDRLTSGRRINLAFVTEDDAFAFKSQTNAADLADDLKLIADKLEFPRWDAAPVDRTRTSYLLGLDSLSATPDGVLARELNKVLLPNDPRWATPDKAQVNALTPASFRAFWEPILKTGPIELLIFGDMKEADAIRAAAASFGALPPRRAAPIAPTSAQLHGPLPNPDRILLTHEGDKDQAEAVLAWPTTSGLDKAFESRKLDILATIFNGRLFDALRQQDGAAYSPNVSSNWHDSFSDGGSFVVSSKLKPVSVDLFFRLAHSIAQDLASKPISADEFNRAMGPTQALVARVQNSELYWMNEMEGATRDPRRIVEALSVGSDLRRITAADIQAVAKTYLQPNKSVEVAVLPKP